MVFVLQYCFKKRASSLSAHSLNSASWKPDAIKVQLRCLLKHNSPKVFPLTAFHRSVTHSIFVEVANGHPGTGTWNIKMKYSGVANGKLLVYTCPQIWQDSEWVTWGTVEMLLGCQKEQREILCNYFDITFVGTSKQWRKTYTGIYSLATVVLCTHQCCTLLCFTSWAAPVLSSRYHFFLVKPFQ